MTRRALLRSRLRSALRPPGRRAWLELAGTLVLYALLVGPLAIAADLFAAAPAVGSAPLVLVAARVLVAPALLEELLFRVLPNPHPDERAPPGRVWLLGALSVAAYVAAHPLAGLLRPEAGAVFARPSFLLAAGLLGLACLVLYRRHGSLWPPALLHAAVVVGWLGWG